ncbi:exonuclease [Fromanvirus L5]|uniref:Gene 69 protein n=1 Tax=Mycobacterium phage L5 TaxID=31757 RepID=VG69_BPML5|nr:exonuclease [Fromanvirus L5]Q05283.1 RecName: Full=Gene 69 protein; AltName: Full=Gp69 [Fromanvirus L5]CAA79445.1 RecB-like [Fromanvirus L5]
MTDTKTLLPLRSVSQLNQYTRCPQAYKLARIDKVWARPAAWLPQGTAFHTVAEVYEKALAEGREMSLERAQEIFREEYAKDIGALCDETPNFEWWFWSGPYNGERDIERRFHLGLEQVEKFIAWRKDKGQQIWTTPGRGICSTEAWKDTNCKECEQPKPAIELPFNIELDGIRVRGFIDAVVVVNGELRVRDYKTGNSPGDDFQLGVYALAVAMTYDVEAPKTGDYFMAGKKGIKAKPTAPYDLTDWTRERITERFHEVEARIQAGDFEPLPEPDKCGFCDVNYSCPVFK